MSIPQAQLEAWAHQGSIAQSSDTFNAIKRALERDDAPYAGRNFSVFLQGSYGNDTNIYAESDVDIVIRLDDCFEFSLDKLDGDQVDAFDAAFSRAPYGCSVFKRDVLEVLTEQYGDDVTLGDKAIKIDAAGSRRHADVIAAVGFRKYRSFDAIGDEDYEEGICLYDRSENRIINYPKQHAANCTKKHQQTNQWFKPMVRILKNMRGELVDSGALAEGVAPSYFLEGLLYNVPAENFGGSYSKSFERCINWIIEADRDKFLCANRQYRLLHDTSLLTWRASRCDEFLSAAVKLWNEW